MPVYFILLLWNIASSVSVNGPVMPLYVRSLGIDVMGWGLLAMSGALGMFFFEWVWGAMSDRLDRRFFIFLSLFAMSTLFPLFTIRDLIPYFLILEFIAGSLSVITGPVTRAMVSDDSPTESMGLFMSLWWAFHTLGRMIGPLVGSYVAQTLSFEHSFYTSAIISLAGALALLSIYRGSRRPSTARRQSFNDITQGLYKLLSIRSTQILFLVTVIAFMGMSAVGSFVPIYASEQIGMSTIQVGMLVAAISAMRLVSTPLLGWLSDRLGRKRIVSAGIALSSVAFVGYFFAKTTWQFLLVSIAVSVCFSASSLLLAMIPEIAPPTLYGAAIGIYGSFEDVGIMVGPVVFGIVWSTYGAPFIFLAASVAQILGLVLMLLIKQRELDRSQEN